MEASVKKIHKVFCLPKAFQISAMCHYKLSFLLFHLLKLSHFASPHSLSSLSCKVLQDIQDFCEEDKHTVRISPFRSQKGAKKTCTTRDAVLQYTFLKNKKEYKLQHLYALGARVPFLQ